MESIYRAAALTSQNHMTNYFRKAKNTAFNGSWTKATVSFVLQVT